MPVGVRAQVEKLPIPQGAKPMPNNPVSQSMAELLDQGYDIVTFSAGLGGFGYLLKRDRTWIMCTVNLYGDRSGMKPYSSCERLNH